ncbi:unnamed protein product [Linum trigynum]
MDLWEIMRSWTCFNFQGLPEGVKYIYESSVARKIINVSAPGDSLVSTENNLASCPTSYDCSGEEVDQSRVSEDGEEEPSKDYLEMEQETSYSSDRISTPGNQSVSNVFNEEPEERYANLPFYDPDCDHEELFFKVGLKFLTLEQFRLAVYKAFC